MDDANAVRPVCQGFDDECLESRAGFFERHVVQVDFSLNGKLTTSQSTHDLARDVGSGEDEFIADFEFCGVRTRGQGFFENGPVIGFAEAGAWFGLRRALRTTPV